MSTLFAGWDVAGWTCPAPRQLGPDARSQDALVLLVEDAAQLVLVGLDVGSFGSDVLAGIDFVRLAAANYGYSRVDKVVLAVDAPLGWPAEFQSLLSWAWTPSSVGGYSSLLYRATDQLHGGQSAVVRSVGAASTKAMAFLQAQRFTKDLNQPGTFTRIHPPDRALETYPKVVLNHALANPNGWFALEYARLQASMLIPTADADAALWCALVAAAYHRGSAPPLKQPTNAAAAISEGWIWAP